MEIPERKLNRLSEYDYGQEGAYFVTLCTQNRAQLFQMELPVGNGLCAVPDKTDIRKRNDTQVVPYDAVPDKTDIGKRNDTQVVPYGAVPDKTDIGKRNDTQVVPYGAVPDKIDIGKRNDTQVVPYDAVPKISANQIIHKWVKETENKFPNIAIDKYVVMPDHLHLIVTIKERHAGRSLPDVMRFFKTMTTNEYIWGVRDGVLLPFNRKLWQKSYYDHVIRNQQDYNEIWEYIENNPLKWELIHNTP